MTRAAKTPVILSLLFLLGLMGCREQVAAPEPLKLTREAIGNFCNMIVADHPGPKAQIFEKDRKTPLWFSSVRDGFAYLALPGEAQKVTAFYVHDMGKAASWEKPQHSGIWIDATQATYVIGSTRRGGMGAREAVPFKSRAAAEKFTREFGGRIVAYKDVPTKYILGDDDHMSSEKAKHTGHTKHGS